MFAGALKYGVHFLNSLIILNIDTVPVKVRNLRCVSGQNTSTTRSSS